MTNRREFMQIMIGGIAVAITNLNGLDKTTATSPTVALEPILKKPVTLLQPGFYKCKVVDVCFRESRATGKTYISFAMKPENSERTVYKNISPEAPKHAERFIKKFDYGINNTGMIDLSLAVGQEVEVYIDQVSLGSKTLNSVE